MSLESLHGNGTEDDPYVITNATELQLLSQGLDAHYELGNDIDAAETATWNGGKGFAPIGNDSHPFTGEFDGKEHTIRGLTVDRPSEKFIGLFGDVGEDGRIANVSVTNVAVSGDARVGGLAGGSSGTVQSVAVRGSVSANASVGGVVGSHIGTVRNATMDGSVTGSRFVGGIVGYAYTRILNSTSNATVSGDEYVGGVVGFTQGPIRHATATGTVRGESIVGGIVGSADAKGSFPLEKSISTGVVNGTTHVGGIAGKNSGFIRTVWTNATVIGNDSVGGLVGTNRRLTDASFSNATVDGNVSVGGLVGTNRGLGDVRTSVAVGSVSGEAETGALVGTMDTRNLDRVFLDSSYWNRDTVGLSAVGANRTGGVANVTGLDTDRMTGRSAAVSMDGLQFFETWAVSSGYPRLAWQTGTVPAVYLVENVTTPPRTDAGGTLAVNATVRNAGDEAGDRTISLTVAGEPIERRTATLAAGETDTVAFEHTAQSDINGSDVAVTTTIDAYRFAAVTGTITDVADTPVGNATVTVSGTGTQPEPVRQSVMDDNDTYRITVSDGQSVSLNVTRTDLPGQPVTKTVRVDVTGVTTRNVSLVRPVERLPGNGTAADPYRVSTVRELQLLNQDRDAHYSLSSDIAAAGTETWNGGAGFDPLGNRSRPFTGTLDGNGHAITGVTVDRPGETHAGLFGFVSGDGRVTNVTLVNTTVRADSVVGSLAGGADGVVLSRVSSTGGTVIGDQTVGGLVGGSKDTTLHEVSAAGNVTGGSYVGGVVGGSKDTTLHEVSAVGNVTGGSYVGGVVGVHTGPDAVRQTYSTASVDGRSGGGIVGVLIEGSLNRSYSAGNVTTSGPGGGLVGIVARDATVTDSYWNRTAAPSDAVGTIDSGTVTNVSGLTTDQLTGTASVSNMTRLDFDATWVPTTGSPRLAWEDPTARPLAQFNVTITDTSAPVTAGESVAVTARVTNTAAFTNTQRIALHEFNGTTVDTTEVTLGPGENATVTLRWQTTEGDGATDRLRVATPNCETTGRITVEAADDSDGDSGGTETPDNGTTDGSGGGGGGTAGSTDASIGVASVDAPETVGRGDVLDLSATVANTGGSAGTAVIEFSFDRSSAGGEAVRLGGGNSTTVAFEERIPPDIEPGEYQYNIRTEEGKRGGIVTITAPDALVVTDITAPNRVTAGSAVEVSATVANTADIEGTGTVDIGVGDDRIATQSIAVDSGGSRTVTFTPSIPEDTDPGDHEVQVQLGESEAATELVVVPPASFEVTAIETPDRATPGDTVPVAANISNTGPTEGTVTAALVLNGQVETRKQIRLAGGETTRIVFTAELPANVSEGYTVSIRTGNSTVTGEVGIEQRSAAGGTTAGTESTTEDTTATDANASVNSNGQPGFTPLLSVCAVVLLFVIRRRTGL
ncbi:hypothetical protein [Halostella salina]|uniref:hypothetical protein n=1 Tax=Halostella salina TaxID=1547897 RepID=UPI000EF78570|nr:hypothetical protein [Halostella salina]